MFALYEGYRLAFLEYILVWFFTQFSTHNSVTLK